ncbi:acetolactate synthase 2 catalytic subunit [Blochmannia endosymbiont of Camponotus (Colobopsis) obliquus]|uniref:acetolactate synthase 2 catalytic subunit n=1 Tax=Blochmannia endosymbiont of Camponotus (Colobopsis) obliquus TaxID=1505597 RepID=UPI00061A8012|nr:acetolactate synthase 2 catalytic subunit [Blochmannia endosymbiont of Camponotus (Colobopsis) obliquus]AKC60733.1 Acetolactate synthase isozyme 2 large subunit [Blochmannia endosymbiont of Camponotus (Colobopsis) obliquus]
MNGAQWIVKAIQQHGVDIIFGYPGGAIMPIYDALLDAKIEHVLCRHEQGAVLAAIGYARTSGKIGVCLATSGPGATNLITGLADALLDSVPLVAITGQVGSVFIGTDAFQEIDILGLSLACTKHSYLVESLELLPDIFREAFIVANSERPGPVLIDIPKDIQLSVSNLPAYSVSVCNKVHNIPSENVEKARILMSKSKKPVLYIGGGVGMSGAVQILREFIKITGIPTVVTLKGLGAPDYRDTCYLGMLGMHGNQAANLAVQKCDLLIAVGARFDDRVTGRLNDFAPIAKVIHLDIDSSELNKLRQSNIVLLGDIKHVLPMLIQPLFIDHWRIEVRELKQKYCWSYESIKESVYAPALLRDVSRYAPQNTIITTDVGQHQMWVAQHMSFDKPENFITSSGLGTMGFGIPAAIGAQIARPKDIVLCISGDGSFMMNVQELTTIKRKKLPIKIILLDNRRLGMVRQWQELFFNERYSETILTDNPDFLTLVSAFDIQGLCITYKNQVANALDRLFGFNGSFLLHVMIDEFENVWPLVPPGAGNENMLEK